MHDFSGAFEIFKKKTKILCRESVFQPLMEKSFQFLVIFSGFILEITPWNCNLSLPVSSITHNFWIGIYTRTQVSKINLHEFCGYRQL